MNDDKKEPVVDNKDKPGNKKRPGKKMNLGRLFKNEYYLLNKKS